MARPSNAGLSGNKLQVSSRLWPLLVLINTVLYQAIPSVAAKISRPTCPTGQTLKTVDFTTSCVNCTACGPGQEPTSSCTPRHDTVCTACPPGTFSNTTCSSSRCHVCTSLQCISGSPFLRLRLRKCTALQDTSCDQCGEGYYKNINTLSCMSCTICLADEEELQPCTLTTNRKCSAKQQSADVVHPAQAHIAPTKPRFVTAGASQAKSTIETFSRNFSAESTKGVPTSCLPKTSRNNERTIMAFAIPMSGVILIALFGFTYLWSRWAREKRYGQLRHDTRKNTISIPKRHLCRSPNERVKFNQTLADTSATFRQNLCAILCVPDSRNGKDWRVLLAAFGLHRDDQEEFSPWMTDDTAKATQAAQLLLKKLSGKDVQDIFTTLTSSELLDAADYVWKANLSDITVSVPV